MTKKEMNELADLIVDKLLTTYIREQSTWYTNSTMDDIYSQFKQKPKKKTKKKDTESELLGELAKLLTKLEYHKEKEEYEVCAELQIKIDEVNKKLSKLDLNKEIPEADNTYDSVLCVGTFTFGHVRNNALDEFLRITKSGGYIGFTINEGIFRKYNFDTKIEEFKNKGLWEEKDFFKSDYIASKNVNAWLGIYKVTK